MIIIFGGRLKSGKTTLANLLIEKDFNKLSFASYLKKTISELYEIPLLNLYDQNLKNKKLNDKFIYNKEISNKLAKIVEIKDSLYIEDIIFSSYREILQYIGTEILRKYDDNFHIKKTISLLDLNKNYVCDDVRYLNELEALKKLNALDYYLIRPNMYEISNHISETSLNWSNFRFNIINNKSLNQFKKNFIKIIDSNFNNEITKHNKNDYFFLKPTKTNSYLAGYIAANCKLNKAMKNIEVYNKGYLNYLSLLKKICHYEYNSNSFIIDNPYIIENLKFWNILPKSLGIPDIIKNDEEMLKHWCRGVFKN